MFFEYGAEFVKFTWTIGGVVSQTRQFLRVRRTSRGRVAGRDKRHVIGSEEVHDKVPWETQSLSSPSTSISISNPA